MAISVRKSSSGFCTSSFQIFSQFSNKKQEEKLPIIAAKVVDNLIIFEPGDSAKNFIAKFNDEFNLGSIKTEPRHLHFFRINLVQNYDY